MVGEWEEAWRQQGLRCWWCREQDVRHLEDDLRSIGGLGFVFLALGVGFAGGDHDFLGLCCKVVDGGFLIQSSLNAGDGGVAMDACLLDGMQTRVQVDELVMLLLKVLAEVVGEVLDQLLHVDRSVSGYQV